MMKTKNDNLKRRRARVRAKIAGTALAPRLSVHVSNKHFYAQAIDDEKRKTLAASSDKQITEAAELSKKERARIVGLDIAAKLLKGKKIKNAVFDRGGKRYAGNVRVLADAAREAGLNF